MKAGKRIYLFYIDYNLLMNNYKILILITIAVTVSLVCSLYLMPPSPTIIKKAIAQTVTTTNASTLSNSSMISGNPIFTETDKSTSLKPVVINGTHGFQVSYSGNGVVKGVNFSAVGTILIMPRSDKALDLNGHAVIATNDGEKGNYTFYSLGYTGADGTTKDNGTATFHTTSSGRLGVVDNLLLVLKDQIDKAGNAMTLGWEWK
jgi:hypothetical protein